MAKDFIIYLLQMMEKSAPSNAKYSSGINKGRKYQSLLLIKNVFVAFVPILCIAALLLLLVTSLKSAKIN